VLLLLYLFFYHAIIHIILSFLCDLTFGVKNREEMDVDDGLDDSWDDIIDVLAADDSLGILNPTEQQSLGLNSSKLAASPNSFHQSSQPSSKKRKANPDADDIAKATEDALMQLGLDPNSDEFKLKKRQIRNRISAQTHRDRKNHHIVELEEEIASKNKRIEALENEIILLKQDNERLRCLAQRVEVSRTSSELSTRTDLESHLSGNLCYVAAVDQSLGSIGSTTPDYTVSSASSTSSYMLANSSPLSAAVTSNNLSLSSSNPILKSLTFICVLCVLCLCSNMSPGTPALNSGTSSTIIGASSSNLVSAQEDSSGVNGLHRRLLATAQELDASPDVLQSALDLLRASTNSSISDNRSHSESVSLMNVSFPKDNLRKRYLQHSQNHSSNSHNNSDVEQLLRSLHDSLLSSSWTSFSSKSSPPLLLPASGDTSRTMRVLRKDLLPYPITQSPQEDWFSYQARIQALSSSQIFLRHGMVLLDPAFRPSDQLAALLSQQLPSSSMRMKRSTSSASLATAAVAPTMTSERDREDLYLPIQASAMDVSDDLASQEASLRNTPVATALLPPPESHSPVKVSSDNSTLDLMLPRLAASTLQDVPEPPAARRILKLPSSPHSRDVESAASASASAPSSATATAASAAAAQLIAESNMMTVTIPVSSIKLGRSLQESEDGSIDSVLRLFNLSNSTFAKGSNSNNSSGGGSNDMRGIGYQNAWVEMNCIVVGAKVMWQSSATEAAAEQATASAMH
jgi:hypothetical protein